MLVTRTHPFTGKVITRKVSCTQAQYDLWQSGVLIQDAMPGVSIHDREFMLRGIDDWDQVLDDYEINAATRQG